jgi:hypothetical protein
MNRHFALFYRINRKRARARIESPKNITIKSKEAVHKTEVLEQAQIRKNRLYSPPLCADGPDKHRQSSVEAFFFAY